MLFLLNSAMSCAVSVTFLVVLLQPVAKQLINLSKWEVLIPMILLLSNCTKFVPRLRRLTIYSCHFSLTCLKCWFYCFVTFALFLFGFLLFFQSVIFFSSFLQFWSHISVMLLLIFLQFYLSFTLPMLKVRYYLYCYQ